MEKTLIFFCVFLFLHSCVFSQELFFSGFNGATNNTNISLNGISEIQNGGILRLTNETSRLIGRAFYPSPIQMKNTTDKSVFSFSSAFAFAIVPEYPRLGGHGFAFTLSPTKELLGGLPSQYLGLFNESDIGNSSNHIFAVEFDTVRDFEFLDIDDNHIGININHMKSNASAPAAYYDSDSLKKNINLKSGTKIQAWIDYDGIKRIVNVSVSPLSTKPSTPLLSFAVDLSPILLDFTYVGFSASTGLLASSHYLFGWNFKMNGIAESFDLSSLPSLPHPKKKHVALNIGAPVISVVFVIFIIVISLYLYRKIKNADVIEDWELQHGPHRFSYKELKIATKGFREKELLGFGGFGRVYKGTLPSSKLEVAVKRVSHESKQGLREFVAEIASIGRLRHRNLVQLQGWCRRKGDFMIVYDYMVNGSLDTYLFDDKAKLVLNWEQRMKILRGVASGLLYLHEEWEHVVIHRDVKASNVLLDSEFNGRLGDFGLARLYEHGSNPATTHVVGTLGYLAPEITRTGKASTAADVFSYGALLLEVACGRRPIDPKALPERMVLVEWVWYQWIRGNFMEVIDLKLQGNFSLEEAEMVLKLGLMCSHPSPWARPSMRMVVQYLNGTANLPEFLTFPESDYEGMNEGFDDFVLSYPSSHSFREREPPSPVAGLSLLSRDLPA